MTPLTDDEVGALLAESFTAHEALADADRSRDLATRAASSRPRSRAGAVLLASAASVALVAGGTTYAVSRGGNAHLNAGTATPGPLGGHSRRPALQTDAANQAAAVRDAERVAGDLPVFAGAQETDAAGVLQLDDSELSSVHPQGHTIVRSRFWTVAGASAKEVAVWYAAHPVSGFSSGGPGAVGGQGDGTTWINDVYYDQPGVNQLTGAGTSVEIQTTATPAGVGIRATVSTVWLPSRPPESFVRRVTSIDVTTRHDRAGRRDTITRRSFSLTSPGEVQRAVTAFNHLSGMTPIVISCPMQRDSYTDRFVFHTSDGDLTAVSRSASCGFGMLVHRDGHRVDPELGNGQRLLAALGIHH